jgi:hypothetical protein
LRLFACEDQRGHDGDNDKRADGARDQESLLSLGGDVDRIGMDDLFLICDAR